MIFQSSEITIGSLRAMLERLTAFMETAVYLRVGSTLNVKEWIFFLLFFS